MKEKGIIEKLGITSGPWRIGEAMHESNNGFENDTKKVEHGSCWIEGAYTGSSATGESKANDRLISAAPEMLEALIISIKHDHKYFDGFFIDWSMDNLKHLISSKWGEKGLEVYDDFIRSISAIEKATNKPWSEIKDLL